MVTLDTDLIRDFDADKSRHAYVVPKGIGLIKRMESEIAKPMRMSEASDRSKNGSTSLPAAHAAKVTTAIVRLGAGSQSGLKPVGQGISERRIDWRPGIRIYLAFVGTKLINLLAGGTKSHQQADISQAHDRWADYKRRKKAKE